MDDVKVWTLKKKEAASKQRGLDAKRFYRQNKEIVVRFLILVLVMAGLCLTTHIATKRELEADFQERLTAARIQTEQETAERIRTELGYYEAQNEAAVMDAEAEEIAKVLYGMQYNTENGLKSAAWCVLNRVDSRSYPGTVADVCRTQDQWVGYSESNPVLLDLKELALEQVKVWHSGVRPMGVNFVFLKWAAKEIVLFDNMGSGAVHYWYESDWEE